jgi:hypothetical protein
MNPPLVGIAGCGSGPIHGWIGFNDARKAGAFIADVPHVEQVASAQRLLDGKVPVLGIGRPHSVFDGQNSRRLRKRIGRKWILAIPGIGEVDRRGKLPRLCPRQRAKRRL